MFNFLIQFGISNVVLATFNLIPIPPLDGSSVVERFLPDRYMQGYYKFRQYSMFLLIFLMLSSGASLGTFSIRLSICGCPPSTVRASAPGPTIPGLAVMPSR